MKLFARLAVALILILAVAGTVLVVKGEDWIIEAVETNGSSVLKTNVALAGVDLQPFAGVAGISGFSIAQPEGYGEGNLFAVNDFSVGMDIPSLMDNHIKINSIKIASPEINAVVMGTKTNFQALMDAMGPSDDSEMAFEKRISIKELALTEMTLSFQMNDGKKRDVKLADIILSDIGVDQNGIPPKEAFRLVMDALEPQVAKAAVSLGLKSAVDQAKDQAKDKANELIKKNIPEELKGVTDAVGSLLKKKKKKNEEGGN